MEWLEILKGPLASTPVAAVLAFAVWKLWAKCEALQADLKKVNEDRLDDLRAIAKLDD